MSSASVSADASERSPEHFALILTCDFQIRVSNKHYTRIFYIGSNFHSLDAPLQNTIHLDCYTFFQIGVSDKYYIFIYTDSSNFLSFYTPLQWLPQTFFAIHRQWFCTQIWNYQLAMFALKLKPAVKSTRVTCLWLGNWERKFPCCLIEIILCGKSMS